MEGDCLRYVKGLKTFIGYLRSTVKVPVSREWQLLFQNAERKIPRRAPFKDISLAVVDGTTPVDCQS